MMTRRATTEARYEEINDRYLAILKDQKTTEIRYRDLNSKLLLTLKELKEYKTLSEQLKKEQVDNELEVLSHIKKNSLLKSEMAEISLELENMTNERNKLKSVVSSFDQCSVEFETILKHNVELKNKLKEAYNTIDQLERESQASRSVLSQSLFEEHRGSSPDLVTLSTISTLNEHNNKSIHQIPSANLCSLCNLRDHNKMQSESIIHDLQVEVQSLKDCLLSMTEKYEDSRRQIDECSAVMDGLLTDLKENEQKLLSLMNYYNECDNNRIAVNLP
ncbi:unnamed protein product [Leptidea sinapis]|uniref:Uncharacterized protein n=1 Tax=Leptidea sinapis TaxID=189913 RepID=A0A5E4QK54_9NEOP|nr:unnamed protein product [Leptidea sinapis]